MEMDKFDEGLAKMGRGIRRTQAAFNEADEGFIDALNALQVITEERGTLDQRFRELRETIQEMKKTLLAQLQEMRALRARLDGP